MATIERRGKKVEQSRIDKIKRIHPGADRGLIMDTIKELVTEVERLQELQSLSGVAKTMAQYVAEIERLQKEVDTLESKSLNLYLDKELEIERLEARIDAYDKYIRGYLTLGQLEEALKEAVNPSLTSHSQTSGGEK